jgi:hypothetical protein
LSYNLMLNSGKKNNILTLQKKFWTKKKPCKLNGSSLSNILRLCLEMFVLLSLGLQFYW